MNTNPILRVYRCPECQGVCRFFDEESDHARSIYACEDCEFLIERDPIPEDLWVPQRLRG